jgi:hypothetical protein
VKPAGKGSSPALPTLEQIRAMSDEEIRNLPHSVMVALPLKVYSEAAARQDRDFVRRQVTGDLTPEEQAYLDLHS